MATFTRSEKVITAYTLAIVNAIETEGLTLSNHQLSSVKAFANKQDAMIRMGHTSTEASKEAIDKFFIECLRHIAPEEDLMDWSVFIAEHNGTRIETVVKESDKQLSAMRSGYRSVRKGL
jgi:hemerythrin